MLALRAAFEALEVIFQAPLERLVITGFEVQAWHSFDSAPIAPPGCALIAIKCNQRGRDGFTASVGDEHHPVIRH